MDEKNIRKLHKLEEEEEEEEEESDGDDTVSLSDYLTDDQEQQLESSTNNNNNNDYSFEFPFNGNANYTTSVNLFGYSFEDSKHNLTPPVKSKSCRAPATESYKRYRLRDLSRHKVLFGLPTRMELTDIRRRQSRKNPVPMFPVVAGAGGERHASVLVVSFKQCGFHLASVFSFGCVTRSRVWCHVIL